MKHTTQPTIEARAIARKIRAHWMDKVDAYPNWGVIAQIAGETDARIQRLIDEIDERHLFRESDINYLRRANVVFANLFIHQSERLSRTAIANNFQI